MSAYTAKKKFYTTKEKKQVNEIVTERLIEFMEKGVTPWKQPFLSFAHQNIISKKPYRGVNAMMCAFAACFCGYKSPYWVTFKQAESLGGHIKRGEKGIPITKFTPFKTEENEEAKEQEKNKNGRNGFYTYSTAFNLDQTEGIPVPEIKDGIKEFIPIEEAEAIISAMKDIPNIVYGKNRAAYYPKLDEIEMPDKTHFISIEEFYSTLFHELGHATGNEKRLGRKGFMDTIVFGNDPYAEEELVAELSCAILCSHCGILQKTEENSAAYLKHWVTKMKQNPQFILTISKQAYDSAQYILGERKEQEAE